MHIEQRGRSAHIRPRLDCPGSRVQNKWSSKYHTYINLKKWKTYIILFGEENTSNKFSEYGNGPLINMLNSYCGPNHHIEG